MGLDFLWLAECQDCVWNKQQKRSFGEKNEDRDKEEDCMKERAKAEEIWDKDGERCLKWQRIGSFEVKNTEKDC